MPRASSPSSAYTVSSSESDDYAPSASPPPTKKRRVVSKTVNGKARPAVRRQGESQSKAGTAGVPDLEDAVMSPSATCIARSHGSSYHSTIKVQEVQEALLSWFENVREKRGMPWRKPYDDSLSMEEKGQRAYEIWVSEIMLQQTQVATVIAYWQRWIERWPTIADLAKADVEEVNAAWRGLGYYRRARSLLAGAKTVMGSAKYKGRLPNDPVKLEKEIDGVGRYTAGAICSMAYGVRTPIIDGNIHRLLTRLLAIHAPQTSPAVIKALWAAAGDLVGSLPVDERDGIAGDWNQALMELGSQVCKPVAPDCGSCPLRPACNAFKEVSASPPVPENEEDECTLCEPIPGNGEAIPAVTVFPMRKEKKASRDEQEVVCVTEWRPVEGQPGATEWLFVKRPEKGLLAGLFEPPTTPVQPGSDATHRSSAISTLSALLDLPPETIKKMQAGHTVHGSVPHIFSHINMTYHVHRLVLSPAASASALPSASAGGDPDQAVSVSVPPMPREGAGAVWLSAAQVEEANVGTGVKKVWAEVYGSWGTFDIDTAQSAKDGKKGKNRRGNGNVSATGTGKGKSTKSAQPAAGEKVVKKIMMPLMPRKS